MSVVYDTPVAPVRSDGSVAYAANQSMGGNKLTSVADPVNPQDAATKAYVDAHAGGGLTGSGSANYLAKWSSATALAASSVYDTGTAVGIGNPTPNDLLDVKGIIRITGIAASPNYIRFDNTANAGGKIFRFGDVGVATGTFNIYNQTDGVTCATFTPAGNVGVGATTAPACKLDVAGTIRSTTVSTPTSGLGVEFGWYAPGGFGFMTAYDRTGGAGQSLQLQGYLNVDGVNGRVGVRTTTPSVPFEVAGLSWLRQGLQVTDNVGLPGAGAIFKHGGNGLFISACTGSVFDFALTTPDGSQGIIFVPTATNNVAYNGNVYSYTDNSKSCGTASNRWTAVYAVNGAIQTSDRARKTDLQPSDLGLEFVLALQPRRFRYLDDPRTVRCGLVAQDVLAAARGRSLGGILTGDPGDYGLNYAGLVTPLVSAVQELEVRLKRLEEQTNGKR